jgi:hypothetical protein
MARSRCALQRPLPLFDTQRSDGQLRDDSRADRRVTGSDVAATAAAAAGVGPRRSRQGPMVESPPPAAADALHQSFMNGWRRPASQDDDLVRVDTTALDGVGSPLAASALHSPPTISAIFARQQQQQQQQQMPPQHQQFAQESPRMSSGPTPPPPRQPSLLAPAALAPTGTLSSAQFESGFGRLGAPDVTRVSTPSVTSSAGSSAPMRRSRECPPLLCAPTATR